MKKRLALSLATFHALFRIVRPFFVGDKKKTAFGYIALLLGLLLLINAIGIAQSYIARDFINALSERKAGEFYHLTFWYIGALVSATIIAVMYRFAEERMALAWREWMTGALVSNYLTRSNYYRIRSIEDIDNPDQRIAEDVRNFTATSLSLFLITLNSIITVVAFTSVVASISMRLVWALLIYTFFGTFITMRIGRKFVRIFNRQYSREANFRYKLVRIRDNAESIAFYRGERREKLDLWRRFRDVLRNTKFLISMNRSLGFFVIGYNNFSLILPTLVIAPLFFQGKLQFGVVTQAAGAFAQVLAATSLLITQFERISAYIAVVARLERLWCEVHALPDDEEPEIAVMEGSKLQLTKLTVRPPQSERELVRELSINLKVGSNILIMGPSGSGKSSILRTIAGLWSAGAGTIQRPNRRDMMFLPQRPYMPSGTLRAQLLYPFRERQDYDKKLKEVLEMVNLEEILQRVDKHLDAVVDWENVLSLGEQQRISFARLFLNEPMVAFLDEATSALDEENEAALYKLLRETKQTFISVGHRSSLMKFHDYVLTLDGQGGWKF